MAWVVQDKVMQQALFDHLASLSRLRQVAHTCIQTHTRTDRQIDRQIGR